MAQKLFVRFSTSADTNAIFQFYNENKHQHVAPRAPEVWRERIASGAVTLIEDEAGTIMAASISYPMLTQGKNGEEIHSLTEIGSTRVALSNAGLFKPLVATQIVRAFLLEPPEERFVLEIMKGNAHSAHSFQKIGAHPYAMSDDKGRAVQSTMAHGYTPPAMEWFHLGAEVVPDLARYLLEIEKSHKIVHKESGQEYELDFSRCALMTHFHRALCDVAQSHFGNVAAPDLGKGIKHHRPRHFGS